MKRLLLLSGLLAAAAQAQVSSTVPGVKLSDLQTLGPTSVFISTTGNDKRNCKSYVTDGGTNPLTCVAPCAPCLTFAGALSKLPKDIRHDVLVLPAPGTYTVTAPVEVQGFHVAANASFAIRGSWQNFTPDAGTATGTLTATDAGTWPEYATLTDSAQTWVAGNLAEYSTPLVSTLGGGGLFVHMVLPDGGTSPQPSPIVNNSTDTLTVLVRPTTVLGSTYAIMRPAVKLSMTNGTPLVFTNNEGLFIVEDMHVESLGNGTCTARRCDAISAESRFISTTTGIVTAGAGDVVLGGPMRLVVRRSRTITYNANQQGNIAVSGPVALNHVNSYDLAATQNEGGNASSCITINASGAPTSHSVSNVYCRAQRSGVSMFGNGVNSVSVINFQADMENLTGTGSAVQNSPPNSPTVFNSHQFAVSNARANCYYPGIQTALDGFSFAGPLTVSFFNLEVRKCRRGISLKWGAQGLMGSNTTASRQHFTGFDLGTTDVYNFETGAVGRFPNTLLPVFSGTATINEINVEGTISTWSAYQALTPPRTIVGPLGARVNEWPWP